MCTVVNMSACISAQASTPGLCQGARRMLTQKWIALSKGCSILNFSKKYHSKNWVSFSRAVTKILICHSQHYSPRYFRTMQWIKIMNLSSALRGTIDTTTLPTRHLCKQEEPGLLGPPSSYSYQAGKDPSPKSESGRSVSHICGPGDKGKHRPTQINTNGFPAPSSNYHPVSPCPVGTGNLFVRAVCYYSLSS